MDYDKAIDYFVESYDIAVALSDKAGELMALNNVALTCSESGKIKESRDYFERAYRIALDLNDSLRIAQVAINLVLLGNMMENISLAEKYLEIASNILNKLNDELELIHLHHAEIGTLFLKEDYDKAEELGLLLVEQLQAVKYSYEKWKTKAYVNIIPEILVQLSKVYEKKNDFDKAVYYAKEALRYNLFLKDEILAYEQLVILYRKKSSFGLALQYMDSVIVKKDSLYKVINNRNLESSQIKFDLLNMEKELAQNRAKQMTERILFSVIFVSVLGFLIASILVLRLKIVKDKQKKILELEKEKNEKLLLQQQLQEKETIALLEQERLTNEIENKNKQLIVETLFQSSRDKVIKELIELISKEPLLEKSTTLKAIIKKLKRQLKDSADINNFLLQFEQANASLLVLLKETYQDLSVDDIQLLSYIYVEVKDIKKIARLLNISAEACQKRKERLAIKLGIKTTDLYNYLLNIMRSSISKELSSNGNT
jgi:tetratricopeptide (TPR) repeat protein